ETRLRLPAPMVQRLLIGVEQAGFVARIGLNAWQTTNTGHKALEVKHAPVQVRERRTFAFVERLDAAGNRAAAAHFLPIGECVHADWQVDDAHRFEPRCLTESINQSNEWKQS